MPNQKFPLRPRGATSGSGQEEQSKKPILGQDQYTSNGDDIFKQNGQGQILDTVPYEIVQRKEAQNLKTERPSSGMLKHNLTPPFRPGYTSLGREIKLWANYLQVILDKSQQILQYSATSKPDLPGARKRRQFFKTVFEEVEEFKALGYGIASDFAQPATLYTSAKLDLGPTETKIFTKVYHDEDESTPRANATSFELTVALVGAVPIPDLLQYIAANAAKMPNFVEAKDDAIRALNIIIAGHPNKEAGTFQSGTNKFFKYPSDLKNLQLSGGLVGVRGYFSSVRTSTMRILLNLNAQCSPFYPTFGMATLMHQFGLRDKSALEGFIAKLRVRSTYMTNSDGSAQAKIRTVFGLSHKRTLELTERKEPKKDKHGDLVLKGNAEFDYGDSNQIRFDCKDFPPLSKISVKDYFLKKYRIKLQYPNIPVLNCGNYGNPLWIPAELCTIMPGQAFRGKLNDLQTKNMLVIASRPPAENATRIMAVDGGLGVIGVLPKRNETLAAFGINVNPKMIVVPGRIVPAPRVTYSENKSEQPRFGAWNMIGKKYSEPGQMPLWTFLRIGGADIGVNEKNAFITALTQYGLPGASTRLRSGPPAIRYEPFSRDIDGRLKAVFDECVHPQKNIELVVVILPSKDAFLYSRVKFWGDVKCGVITCCLQSENLKKGPNYFANVALKVNMKCGGSNQTLLPNDLDLLRDGSTMLVGLDVTHPAPKSMTGTPSIAGIVASIDGQYGRYPGNVRCQASRTEMIESLDVLMKERLQLWMLKNNGRKPRNIMIYRDGVSEGQYKTVLEVELPQIREACRVMYGASPPKLSIIIAGKRHHTRFYPQDADGADERHNNNPKPGTVVDRGVTMQGGWDFFLIAHAALQGTARPCHYVVLLDELKLGADQIIKLTHSLCYLQGRCTKAVSICPPAYYADLICDRARLFLAEYLGRSWPPGKEFDWNEAPWLQGLHGRVKDGVFYM